MKKQLKDIVCDHLNVSWNDVISKKRDDILVTARLIYFHIAITEIGIRQIAEQINRERSELYHYKKVFRDRMINKQFESLYYAIEKEYYSWPF